MVSRYDRPKITKRDPPVQKSTKEDHPVPKGSAVGEPHRAKAYNNFRLKEY